jgi:hypothetical protein
MGTLRVELVNSDDGQADPYPHSVYEVKWDISGNVAKNIVTDQTNPSFES